ncbi:MAG: aminopeptidase P family protein [Ignavibacteriales bacterium]|nr:aminopeptidase P family protein [Ignavibacteriales bacterium]
MNSASSYFNSRLQKLRSQIDSLKINAFLITFQPHLRYISGFSGSAGVGIVTQNNAYLLTDGRYATQVRKETSGWKIFITPNDLFEEIKKQRLLHTGMKVGFDGNTLIFGQFQQLKNLFSHVKFLPKVDVINKIAAVKDQSEISKIQKAIEITDKVFTEILSYLKPGVREIDIAAEISYRHLKHGAEGDGFPAIVASGERSALPHGRASQKKLKSGELVTLDFGCIYEGYHSDMTRTVILGKLKQP